MAYKYLHEMLPVFKFRKQRKGVWKLCIIDGLLNLIPSAKSPSPDPRISATSGLKSIFFLTLSRHVTNFLYRD